MKDLLKNNVFFSIGFVGVLLSFLCTYEVPFFWDSISKSLRATWFYEHQFSQWVLPTDINSGHPPLWTWSLAFVWSMFGRTLLISRLYLLLLNIIVVYQLQGVLKKYANLEHGWYWYLIVFLEPTYMAQTTIMNNDVLLLMFCLLGVNSIFNSRMLYSFALVGMLFCNLRGVLFFGGFFIFDMVINYKKEHTLNKEFLKLLYPYVIPVICYVLFLLYQYKTLGWILVAPVSNWGSQRELVGIKMLLHNMVATTWVFLDYGRFWYLLVTTLMLFWVWKVSGKLSSKTVELLLLVACIGGVNVGFMLFTSNPIGHRYFMLFYLLLLIVFVNLLVNIFQNFNWSKGIMLSALMFLLSGHFWIYPETISQGWDSSLAYLSYFEVKKDMQSYILKHQISPDNIGTKTRNPTEDIAQLTNNKGGVYVEVDDVFEKEYYLHSNIENSTKDDEIYILKNNFILIQEFKNNGVFIRLYKNSKSF